MSAFLFRFREPLSAANSAILTLLLLLWFGALIPAPKQPTTGLPPIELILIEPQIEPQTLPPIEPQLAQPAPKAERTAPRAVAQAVVPATAPAETGDIPASSAQPLQAAHPAHPAQLAPLAPLALPVVIPVPAAQPPPPPINSGREAEAVYVGKVRAYLQSIKRYPTGREASLQRPAGTTVIWFSVRRNGDLADAGIETSSGAMLLDNTALATVRRGSYPTFPDEAWAGKAQQRFTVELDFVPK